MIHITLLATFRLAAGVKSFDLELPDGSSILDAAQRITRLYPALRVHWFDADGELHAHVHIFLNGEDAANLPTGLETILAAGSTLDFFPPVAGGCQAAR